MAETRRDMTDTGRPAADANRDPITGEPVAHPVGTGLGAAAGGAAAGGLAGKGIAESFDPMAEDAYWRQAYASRPYHGGTTTYDEYQPAYRYGWEARARHAGRSWDEVERDLERGWNSAKANSRLAWDRAKHAARDAWDRIERLFRSAHHRTEGSGAPTDDMC
jgi:hypothetical protein